MLVNRTIGRIAAAVARRSKPASLQPTPAAIKAENGPTLLTKFYRAYIAPWYFRMFTGPLERWQHACLTRYLREHGLMYDDLMSEREPIVERALEMLPEDMAIARFRRIVRGMHISMLRMYPPLEDQNYDPFIPYLAPYIEEAKFQIQEEEELLGYHPQDRRVFCGGTTGFGDMDPGMHFLTSLPNLYGAAVGNMKKK